MAGQGHHLVQAALAQGRVYHDKRWRVPRLLWATEADLAWQDWIAMRNQIQEKVSPVLPYSYQT